MLAQNFKTPEELNLTQDQFNALYGVMLMFERGEIKEHEFNMAHWEPHHSSCGTSMCIGGWAEEAFGVYLDTSHSDKPKLFSLVMDYSLKTTEQAALAIRAYLSTGDHRNWK